MVVGKERGTEAIINICRGFSRTDHQQPSDDISAPVAARISIKLQLYGSQWMTSRRRLKGRINQISLPNRLPRLPDQGIRCVGSSTPSSRLNIWRGGSTPPSTSKSSFQTASHCLIGSPRLLQLRLTRHDQDSGGLKAVPTGNTVNFQFSPTCFRAPL